MGRSMRWSSRIAASLMLASLSAALAHAQDLASIHKKKFVMGTVFEIVRRQVRYYGGSFGEFLESYHAWGPRRPFFRGGRKTSTLCWLREDRACSSRWCGAPLPLLANRSRSYWQRLRSGSCGSGSALARYF